MFLQLYSANYLPSYELLRKYFLGEKKPGSPKEQGDHHHKQHQAENKHAYKILSKFFSVKKTNCKRCLPFFKWRSCSSKQMITSDKYKL